MPDAKEMTEAFEWIMTLSDHDLKWHLLVLADDASFHSDVHRRALVWGALKRMGF